MIKRAKSHSVHYFWRKKTRSTNAIADKQVLSLCVLLQKTVKWQKQQQQKQKAVVDRCNNDRTIKGQLKLFLSPCLPAALGNYSTRWREVAVLVVVVEIVHYWVQSRVQTDQVGAILSSLDFRSAKWKVCECVSVRVSAQNWTEIGQAELSTNKGLQNLVLLFWQHFLHFAHLVLKKC